MLQLQVNPTLVIYLSYMTTTDCHRPWCAGQGQAIQPDIRCRSGAGCSRDAACAGRHTGPLVALSLPCLTADTCHDMVTTSEQCPQEKVQYHMIFQQWIPTKYYNKLQILMTKKWQILINKITDSGLHNKWHSWLKAYAELKNDLPIEFFYFLKKHSLIREWCIDCVTVGVVRVIDAGRTSWLVEATMCAHLQPTDVGG